MRLPAVIAFAAGTAALAPPALPAAADHDSAPIAAGRLAQDPEEHYGRHVRVRGEISRVLEGRAFTLDEARPLAGPDLLVLVPRPLDAMADGQTVTVTGYVRRFDVADLRRDYAWLDDAVPASLLDAAGRRPVVIADTIAATHLDDALAKRRARLALPDPDWDVAPLTAGQHVFLSDVRVARVLGPTTLIVRDESGRDLVVRVDGKGMVPSEGDALDLSGTVHRVPTAIDTWDVESDSARRLIRSKAVFLEAKRITVPR